MSVPWQSAHRAHGLLLLRGEPEQVARWVSRGLVACHVVPLHAWTAVVPAADGARAQPPYDDAVGVLAARPVGHRHRPALGFFVVDERAVVTVQPPAWRAVNRWLVWEPGRGPVRTPQLAAARPGDLVAAAGAGHRTGPAQVAGLLRDPNGDAPTLLTDLLVVLGLPGAQLLGADSVSGAVTGRLTGRRVVEPDGAEVTRFDALMHDDAQHRAESEA